MALQTSIAQYFNSRKRRAVDEIKKVSNSNKVLILDKNITDVSLTKESDSVTGEGTDLKRTVIFNESPKILKPKLVITTAPKLHRRTPKTVSGSKIRGERQGCNQGDIRKSLLASFDATLESASSPSEQKDEVLTPKKNVNLDLEQSGKVNVPFIVKGFLSPKKECNARVESSPAKAALPSTSNKSNIESLKNLRSKIISSSRLDEIRKSLKNINEGHVKLKEIGTKLQSKNVTDSPTLKKFSAINLEVSSPTKRIKEPDCIKVPSSPSLLHRSILMSPGKTQGTPLPYVSPRKLFTEASPTKKSFERYSHLSSKDKSSLVLPYKYRVLAETFRAIDAVVSMMFNRNETIFFSKLKTSVQQMSKKNLTETHLGQISTIYPTAFEFKQEKLRQGPGQAPKYELSIRPLLEKTSGDTSGENEKSESSLMTPSMSLERRRKMYDALLNLTKDHHQEFLNTLDPPMNLDKNKVTRWHPEFEVDSVPDIVPSLLPLPPNVEKFSSAKDVLNKARDIFMCNPRMASALEKNSSQPQAQNTTSAAASIPALTSALKGIPKSLLEKVRAKQAAKAASMLTRNPEAVKRRIEYSRLREIARIVRNTFIAEKKTVLPKSLLLDKLSSSYREILTPNDMTHHLNLLMESSPEWMTTINNRGEIYLKILRELDLSVIHENIDKLINQI
ncbi:DNA replication factor Cdt1 [Halyomorpha halys]|uniref:DNA replication factor Cdt1 n=1 Tax=Halyomorpha halys TaxID=286706 RepID=UPI0006D51EB9|nr:DNA replication factor Cdt1 [Halyomorpha halys]